LNESRSTDSEVGHTKGAATVRGMRNSHVEDRLATTRGIDALVSMGYDRSEIESILERWGTWWEWSSDSWEERARILGHRGHVHVPSVIPEMRGSSFGQVVSFVDHGWPEPLYEGSGVSVIESRGVIAGRSVAIVGSEWPSARGIVVARELARAAAGYGFAVVSVERGVGRAALSEARRIGAAVSVLYGDSGVLSMRGCVGGARARFAAEESSGAIHLRGSRSGADGLRTGIRAVVSLAEAVYIVEGGVGRSPGVEAEAEAGNLKKPCIWVRGGEGRGEWYRGQEVLVGAALDNLKELAKKSE